VLAPPRLGSTTERSELADVSEDALRSGRHTQVAYTVWASEAAGWSRVGRATGRREESPSSPAQGGG
jgi:hypothetical protein